MTNTHRITAVDVRNFKRLDQVRIEPDADSHLLLIAGNNAQGKSSLLDALTVAFGGGRELPPDPIRHGKSSATIDVQLDGGTYLDLADATAAARKIRWIMLTSRLEKGCVAQWVVRRQPNAEVPRPELNWARNYLRNR